MDPPVEIFEFAGDTKNTLAAIARLGPHGTALAGAMHDPVGDAAQRNDRAVVEGCRLRQPPETRRDPAAVTLRKVFSLLRAFPAAALSGSLRGHSDGFARCSGARGDAGASGLNKPGIHA